MVCALGLEDQLVGVTHECDFPESVRGMRSVTRSLIPGDASSAEIDGLVREKLRTSRALYELDGDALEELKPDLIVTQTLCDVCAVAEAEVRSAVCRLSGDTRVVNLEPQSLHDVFGAIRQVAEAAGVESRAEEVVGALQARVARVASASASLLRRPSVVLLEWLDPPFSCGHWNPELVSLAGGAELIGRVGEPSRTISWDEVRAARPEVVFVACCGLDVERAALDLRQAYANGVFDGLEAGCRVYLADGAQYFNRPGPRLVDSLEILAGALHPEECGGTAVEAVRIEAASIT